jgi:hypothetical protein
MTVIADYTEEEQELLRSAIESAAVAVSAASPGRSEETVSEGFAAADFVLKSQPEFVGNTLVTSLLVQLQLDLKAGHVFPNYLDVASAPGAFDESMLVLGRVAALLDAKASPEEAAGYKGWLLDVARVVARAGKEDQGFLGRGGVMVNEAERATLEGIARALGVEPPSRS